MPRKSKPNLRGIAPYQDFPVQEFRLPFSPPPAALVNKRTGGHWTQHRELTAEYKKECGWEFKAQASPWMMRHGPIRGAFAIHVHVGWEEGRWPDLDAPTLAVKALIDSLKGIRFIVDDSQMEFYSLSREAVKGTVGFVEVEIRPYREGER